MSPAAPERADIWVVLPTYDEAENVEPITAAILDALPGRLRVLIVDDASPDGTGQIADRLAAESESVEVLHREAKQGLGPAYLAGFARALEGGARLVVEMDADFSHDPAYLPGMIEASERADLVIGSRYVPGGGIEDWGPLRRSVSKFGSTYARRVLGMPTKDLTGGFKVFRREALEAIDLHEVSAKGYAFQIEMTYRAALAGMRIVEYPIVFSDRELGTSKMSGGIVLEAVFAVPAMRLRLGGRKR